MKRNYRALTREALDGSGAVVPLLPHITDDNDSVTFTHPEGLPYATQFTQPALVLVEKAAFDDMNAGGLIPTRAFPVCGALTGGVCRPLRRCAPPPRAHLCVPGVPPWAHHAGGSGP